MMESRRCVIVGGADIDSYERARGYLREDDYLIYCDSGLRHMEGLGMGPSLVVGDLTPTRILTWMWRPSCCPSPRTIPIPSTR